VPVAVVLYAQHCVILTLEAICKSNIAQEDANAVDTQPTVELVTRFPAAPFTFYVWQYVVDKFAGILA
jgi:hypothetical protein